MEFLLKKYVKFLRSKLRALNICIKELLQDMIDTSSMLSVLASWVRLHRHVTHGVCVFYSCCCAVGMFFLVSVWENQCSVFAARFSVILRINSTIFHYFIFLIKYD
jgi:hypothetical protein